MAQSSHTMGNWQRCRVTLLWLWVLALPCWAVPEIIGLPPNVEPSYDLTWTLRVTELAPQPLEVAVEHSRHTIAYRFLLTPTQWQWHAEGTPPTKDTRGSLALQPGQTYTVTLKRRAGTVAVLVNHLLVGCTPAPTPSHGRLTMTNVPSWACVEEVRYLSVGPRLFGDDFMRPTAREDLLSHLGQWMEDRVWQVAYYRTAWPGVTPRDPVTGRARINPWQLGIVPASRTTPNGCWFLYTGSGPSWVVAHHTLQPASWDRYSLEAAVKPEYDSAVGLIAAYQDNTHYLLFRWEMATDRPGARAALYAIREGQFHRLADAPVGFQPRQWYTLRLNLGWDCIQVCIDGQVILSTPNPGFIEGRVGLYADGAATPAIPPVDPATATLYGETTADVDLSWTLQSIPCIYFDDVRVGDWERVPNLTTTPRYAVECTGTWQQEGETLKATAPGQWLGGADTFSRYHLSTAVHLTPGSSGGLLCHMDRRGNGYAWIVSETEMQLCEMQRGRRGRVCDRIATPTPVGNWIPVEVDVDGPYLAIRVPGTRPLELYDTRRTEGRCGVVAYTPGVAIAPCALTMQGVTLSPPQLPAGIIQDPWVSTWARDDALWVPATPLAAADRPPADLGPAAPVSTTTPGLYWHKGRHYHDVCVTIPLYDIERAGQTLHLTSWDRPQGGYRLTLAPRSLRLCRAEALIATYRLPLGTWTQLIISRRGTYLLGVLRAREADGTRLERTHTLFWYRDPSPIPAEQIGVTVTDPRLPAAHVQVTSDWTQETFTRAPTAWQTAHGVWGLMTRYACDPRWNWFGGYGATTPTVWSKAILTGNQSVEAYIGIKLEYDNVQEEYARRFRDVNLSICADGQDPDSGYTLARGRIVDGQPVTQLLRQGRVVWSSTAPEDLLPAAKQGHRQWLAQRLVKSETEIAIYLDNRLAGTYRDPNPLPGGQTAVWTRNNGIVIGRINYSADHLNPVSLWSQER